MVRAFDGVLRFPVAVLQLFRGRMRRQLYPLWHTCILQPDSVLFTEVRGIRILGSSYPAACINRPPGPRGCPLWAYQGRGGACTLIRGWIDMRVAACARICG